MIVTKCDLCKKKIKGEPVIAGDKWFSKVELCKKCGSPILKFLKKHKFIEVKKDKKK
ncbi:hypothetical protein KJ841_01835 [Patescibacteria group bacterium]|nr:hypothetical protein [Patescibacteria group bacterium]